MITLDKVTKQYKTKVNALEDVSLHIGAGEFVYLMGESGSGKSTLMKLLYRQEIVNKGRVLVGGFNVGKIRKNEVHQLRREIGVVFQDFRLLQGKTVFENIAYVLEVTGHSRQIIRERTLEALEIVRLKHKFMEYPKNLSGGEQQRVAIARAIVNKPKVLLADEPTGNLDPGTATEIMRVFYRINQLGTTIVMATHNHDLVEKIPYRVIELSKGKLQRDRSKEHISLIYNDKMGDYFVV